MKKALRILGVLLLIIIGLVILIPYLYQDQIEKMILDAINKELDGEVIIDDISVGLIRSFPDLRVGLTDIEVRSNKYPDQALLKANQMVLDLNLMSVIKKEETVLVNKIGVEDPEAYIFINSQGVANYDIYNASAVDEDTTANDVNYDILLESYWIDNAKVTYIDMNQETFVTIDGLNHTGSGRYQGDHFAWDTETDIASFSVDFDQINYVDQAQMQAAIKANINTSNQHVTLLENSIQINELVLAATGWLQPKEDRLAMELVIDNPVSEFGQLWSVLPQFIRADFEGLQTQGQYKLNGKVEGDYVYETAELPTYAFELKVDDGQVSYSQIPKDLRDIAAHILVDNKTNNENQLDIRHFEFKAGKSYLKAKAELAPVLGDYVINGFADIDLKLEDLPIDGEHSGSIFTNIKYNASLDAIERNDPAHIFLEGTAKVTQVSSQLDGYPKIDMDMPAVIFSPAEVSCEMFSMTLGQSDVAGSFSLKKPLQFFTENGNPELIIQSNSQRIDANEWLSNDSDENPSESDTLSSTSLLPVAMQVNWSGEINQLLYDEYQFNNISGQLLTDGQQVEVRDGSVKYEEVDFQVDGRLNHVGDWVYEKGILKGDVQLSGQRLNLNPFMEAEETSTENTVETDNGVIVLPKDVDVSLLAEIKEIIYGEMTLKNFSGKMELAEQVLAFEDVRSQYLGGQMALVGDYQSDGQSDPKFNLKYDVIDMPFQGVAEQIKALDEIIPIAKFIEGIFNSTLVLEGKLGTGMFPDLSTLTASGYIETLEGQLAQLPFIEKVSKALSVDALKNLSLENTKNWFEINDGTFVIQPFQYVFEGIALDISGSTSLDKTVAFNVKADIPKEKFDQVPGGQSLNQGMKWLTDEINQKGIPFGEVKSYTVGIDVNGAIRNPGVKVKLLNFSRQNMSSVLEEKKEEIKETLKDTLEKKKQEVLDQAKEEVNKKTEEVKDSISKKVQEEVDKKVDEVKKELNEKAGEKIDSLLNKKGDETIDKIKDKLKDFKVFKKK